MTKNEPSPRLLSVLSRASNAYKSHRLFTAVYDIEITTTNESYAGTDADVFIRIFGNLGNTSVHQLKKSGNLFETGR